MGMKNEGPRTAYNLAAVFWSLELGENGLCLNGEIGIGWLHGWWMMTGGEFVWKGLIEMMEVGVRLCGKRDGPLLNINYGV